MRPEKERDSIVVGLTGITVPRSAAAMVGRQQDGRLPLQGRGLDGLKELPQVAIDTLHGRIPRLRTPTGVVPGSIRIDQMQKAVCKALVGQLLNISIHKLAAVAVEHEGIDLVRSVISAGCVDIGRAVCRIIGKIKQ